MSDGKLKRKLGPWETVRRWLTVGAVSSLLATVVAVGVSMSDVGQPINGMSYLGFLYGILAVGCTVITMVYSQKKRNWFGSNLAGTMMSWLFSHVTIGLVGLVFAVFHVGVAWQNMGFNLSWLLMFAFVVVVLSGIWWRVVYHKLPKSKQSSIRNYSLSYSTERAKTKAVEIEKLRAGCSESFRKLSDAVLNGGAVSQAQIDNLSLDEQRTWRTFEQRLAEMHKHEARFDEQVQTHIGLQIWRLIHIPASLAMIVLLPLHVLTGLADTKYVNDHHQNFESAEACASCHTQIYEDWSLSMHAHALISPTNLVQTRADIYHNTLTDDKDVQSVCVNCHSPLAVQVLGYNDPIEPLDTEHPAAKEGVTCVVCHQYNPKSGYGDKELTEAKGYLGKAKNSGIGSWDVFRKGIGGGRSMNSFERENDGTNLYHDVEYIGETDGNPYAEDSSHFCASCHNVHIDRSSMGMEALKLQSIYDEWREQGAGAQGACLDCHAEPGHSHQFIGVDYPLDKPDIIAKTRSHREWLLQGENQSNPAVGIQISNVKNRGGWEGMSFDVTLTNRNVGHNFPAGFAFARQSWLEIVVTDSSGRVTFESGVLDNPSEDDLCDKHTMTGKLGALSDFVVGCSKADTNLINLQFILTDDEGKETPLQHAKGSVKLDRIENLKKSGRCSGPYPMALGQSMTCTINTGLSSSKAANVQVKLNHRNLPPYFLRAMDAMRAPNETIRLIDYIPNLEVITISEDQSRL